MLEPAPRVQNEMKTEKTMDKNNANREQLRQNTWLVVTQQAKIPQYPQMQLQMQEQTERAQLIHNKETGANLNYHQLIRNPKHKETWSWSAANELRHLAQGVGGWNKGTNTIFFIHKNQVPQDRIKDVTYGSFICDCKPNKTEKE